MKKRAVVLCVLDGWGYSENKEYNAIANANTKFYDSLLNNYPNALLKTNGKFAGLPENQMGNSEVGHMTMGAGRVLLQDLPKLTNLINDNDTFFSSNAIIELINRLPKDKVCHLIGLISDGGVHSHIEHIITVAQLLKSKDIKVKLHAITDGRDSAPKSVKQFLKQITRNNIDIATISGRYYAMDRDNRWEQRTKKAYECIVNAEGKSFSDINSYLDLQYSKNITDEFFIPAYSNNYDGFKDRDALFVMNFRADRIRQLLYAMLIDDFKYFLKKNINLSCAIGVTEYSSLIKNKMFTLLNPAQVKNNLSEALSLAGKKQLKLAETEKYAHVTYFFNSGQETKYTGEDQLIIPSKRISTYDKYPQMSAQEITDKLIEALGRQKYDFICVNYANPDMVGHTGNFEAAKEACSFIDQCLERVVNTAKKLGAEMIITADHGNAEEMLDLSNLTPKTSHTLNDVPIIYIGDKNLELKNGELSDVAPTILDLMSLNKPIEMTGQSLIKNYLQFS